jgi:hypothetical protein
MSEQATEARSSVAIDQTAKGDPTVHVKVYAETLDLDAVDVAAAKAVEVYKWTCAEVGA